MKKRANILLICLSGLTVVSCNDLLDMKKEAAWEDYYTWNVKEALIAPLNKAYQGNPALPDNFGDAFLDAATDNAIATNKTSSAWLAGNGGISKTSPAIGNWDLCYNMFQYIHEFMRKGFTDDVFYYPSDETQNAAMKRRVEGEAYFLRGWWGFQLLQRFGGRADDGKAYGYPIVTEFIDPENADNPELFVRNTYEECVLQILSDCDRAFELLAKYDASDNLVSVYWDSSSDEITGGTNNYGRASALAAYMLKSRVALYAASPAFHDASVVAIDGMGQYTVVNPEAYKAKWERAAVFAKQTMNLPAFGSYTFLSAPSFSSNPNNEIAEYVFRYRSYGNRNMENRHGPPSNFGQALTQPSHNLYMACAVADGGYPLNMVDESGYDANAPYALTLDNRAVNLMYRHGSAYGSYSGNNHTVPNYFDLAYGNRDTPAYSPDATVTGYYLKKFILPNIITDYAAPANPAQRYYPYMRKSEVFFNYAEAMNELYGPDGTGTIGETQLNISARTQMAEIRTKAGITTDTYLTGLPDEDMAALIQNERRLEFAFENHRFFDMRRRLLPLDEPIKGIKVTHAEGGGYAYEEYLVETRPMNEIKYYYLPLPESELQKNSSMKNNMGWD